jgi:hypothetical protein
MRKIRVVVALSAAAALELTCASFGDSGGGSAARTDGAADGNEGEETAPGNAGPEGEAGACWPPGTCSNGFVCCLDYDGGSACAEPVECPSSRAHVQCRHAADCADGSTCCLDIGEAMADSGYTWVQFTDCRPGACPGDQPLTACVTDRDCTHIDGATKCSAPEGAYLPPSGLGACTLP